ncbi:MAG: vanadium-dependent haloperoxidase [Nitrospirota bacterium]
MATKIFVNLPRRSFLSRLGGFAAATAVSMTPFASLLCPGDSKAAASERESTSDRRTRAFRIRRDAARFHRQAPWPLHQSNGDENRYPNKIASYSKGMPHNDRGEVDIDAYASLLRALNTGDPDRFEMIPAGCPEPSLQRRLVNPQAGLAFDLEGADSHELAIPPAPAFDSAEEAGEIVENYWMALLRDVPFLEYDTHPLAQDAADDIDALSDFRGPKIGGHVTTSTLFRGLTDGDMTGPYLSQFFLLPAPFGANYIEQKLKTTLSGVDYITSFADWLAIENGCRPSHADQFEPNRRYIISGRDLGQWVHVDVLHQAYFTALLCMLDMGVPHNPGNPYIHSATQDGFGTFGAPYFATIVPEVATRALKAVWFQKWFVHRRIRPEEFAARIHLTATGQAGDPIHKDALNSAVLPLIASHNYALNGNESAYLLPMAYPEGSPLHPAYGAGHATVAGACVTILKALFDEHYVIPNPLVPNADGSAVVPYQGPPLTVGGELNKLAGNVAMGRNIAGVHWRSDATASLQLGEAVALGILRDQHATYNEDFHGFTFTKFDGNTVTV